MFVVLYYCSCIVILFPKRSYQSSRCLAVCFRVMSESLCHVRVMSRSCQGHVRVMSGSYLGYVRVMTELWQGYDRVMSVRIHWNCPVYLSSWDWRVFSLVQKCSFSNLLLFFLFWTFETFFSYLFSLFKSSLTLNQKWQFWILHLSFENHSLGSAYRNEHDKNEADIDRGWSTVIPCKYLQIGRWSVQCKWL